MRIIHIVGKKSQGKTTLVVELVEELSRRGLKVGTIKHSGHDHELDTPGKDSHRHRQAGAAPSAVVTPGLIALYVPRQDYQDPYSLLRPQFMGCDLVLVEGHAEGPGPKVEVWRKETGKALLAEEREDIIAVITDDPVDTALPVWPRKEIATVADRIVELLEVQE